MFHHDDHPEKIVHISDEDFFSGLDLETAGLEKVRNAISSDEWNTAFSDLWTHWLTREQPVNPLTDSR